MNYSVSASGITDAGRIKSVNEDSVLVRFNEDEGIFAVADGVGGLQHGEVASSTAVRCVDEWWCNDFGKCKSSPDTILSSLKEKLRQCNEQLGTLPYKTATTLSVLIIYQNRYYIFHIGDSRIYTLCGMKKQQLTVDHSVDVKRGDTVKKGVLSEYLGYDSRFNPYTVTGECRNKQRFLLCSDGVYKTTTSSAILRKLKNRHVTLESLCQSYINDAKKQEETDNITAIVVEINK